MLPRSVAYPRVPPMTKFATPVGAGNPIAAIDGNILHLAGIDILDNTPLLDIKPYVPEYDVYPVSQTGWIGVHALSITLADGRFEQEAS